MVKKAQLVRGRAHNSHYLRTLDPIGTPVFRPFREKHLTTFPNEAMSDTTLQLFVVAERTATSVGASRARQQSGIAI
jgi:hypothetical protein